MERVNTYDWPISPTITDNLPIHVSTSLQLFTPPSQQTREVNGEKNLRSKWLERATENHVRGQMALDIYMPHATRFPNFSGDMVNGAAINDQATPYFSASTTNWVE